MRTIIGVGDPSAVKRFSAMLFVDQCREGYWSNRFMKKGADAMVPVQILTELENDAGDTITYDLFAQARGKPVFGDERLKGKEEPLKKYNDSISIDQIRYGNSAGGRMTRKRVLHDLRMVARKLQADWWSRFNDEALFCYSAGARGINADFIMDTNWTGYAGNSFQAPDTTHQMYAGAATSKASMVAGDVLSLATIDKVKTKAVTMGGGTTGVPKVRPITIEGENHYVYLMHTFDAYQLRTNTSTGQWLDIQKAAAAAQGQGNPIFKGGLGMYNDVILHEHQSVIRFNDYGAGANVPASRNTLLGCQALVMAYGSSGNGLRYDWFEEMDDRGNELVIDTSTINGIKKTRFNSMDYGVISVDVSSPEVVQ